MLNSNSKFELICEKWAPIANEYAKFLNRYGMQTICIISKTTCMGPIMKVFADEDKYLELSMNNKHFVLEENQINELLKAIETLSIAVFYSDECEEKNNIENESEYEIDYHEEEDNSYL